MRPIYDKLIQNLIAEFSKMPTIGTRTAERMSYYVLKSSKEATEALCNAIRDVNEKITKCSKCNNFTEKNPCEICNDEARNKGIICVVEEPHDLVAIEKTGKHNGLYHVLLGVLSPLEGVGPENIKISDLIDRVKNEDIKEVILATNTTASGETTALYISNMIRKSSPSVVVTRIAYGLSVGADLEYSDPATISKSLEGRYAF